MLLGQELFSYKC